MFLTNRGALEELKDVFSLVESHCVKHKQDAAERLPSSFLHLG